MASFPLLGQKTTVYISYYCITTTILSFSSSNVLFIQVPKNGYNYMGEAGGAFTCSGMKEQT